MVKRIQAESCCGILVDVQEFFLRSLAPAERARIDTLSAHFLGLCTHLRVPVLATLENPVAAKGGLPPSLLIYANRSSPPQVLEKDYFDLSRDPKILNHVASLGRRQVVLAGCETDVCVLQSCLGLLEKGYEVFVVEDLLFSSSPHVASALARMGDAGAVILTYKTLFHELLQAVEGSGARKSVAGPDFPRELEEYPFA